MKHTLILAAALMLVPLASAAQDITVKLGQPSGQTIPATIYGQFSEHLGRCIYGGIWVGKESNIPNQEGYRSDVLEALRALKVPVLRWPGGCFADDYHWMDGIGPQEERTKICNNNWGGDLEDNSFGTHEFLNFCELIGTEPYISGNVGSGTPEEMAKWVEYMTSDSKSTVAEMRRANGRDKAWDVSYFGIGNEAWGCGGEMTPEYYSDLFRRYGTYTRNFNGRLYKVASGSSGDDYHWTEVLMQKIGSRMQGLSLHYYTLPEDWTHHGSATDYTDESYYITLRRALDIEPMIQQHIAIMDKYDPEGKVDLLVDEWGTWYDVEPGTNPGHLFQQSTMRDAMVAALSLDIFHKYTRRIKMANIAQVVNVLQAMILTDSTRIVLTPTYHIFEMYNVHQDAEWIPLTIDKQQQSDTAQHVPQLSATASQKDGLKHISLTNTSLDKPLSITLKEIGGKVSQARVLTSEDVHTTNTFDQPHRVEPKAFTAYKQKKDELRVTLPPCSVVAITIKE